MNRILLELKNNVNFENTQKKSILNGTLEQGVDNGNYATWEEVGARPCTAKEKEN